MAAVILDHSIRVSTGAAPTTTTAPAIDARGAAFILALCGWFGTANHGLTEDDQGNLYTPLADFISNTSLNPSAVTAWYCAAPVVTSALLVKNTSTGGVSSYPSVSPIAIGGLISSPVDQSDGQINTDPFGVNHGPAGSITTAEIELVFTSLNVQGRAAAAATIDSGFTVLNDARAAGLWGFSTAYKLQSAAGTENPVWTYGISGLLDYAANILSLKIASGGRRFFLN